MNSASSLITRMLSVTVLLWMNKYLLDQLAPEEFSLYPVIASVIAFAPLMSGFLTSGVARFVVEAHAQGDDRRITQIVSTMFPLISAASIGVFTTGLLVAHFINDILTIDIQLVADAQLMVATMAFEVACRLMTLPFCIGPYVCQRFVLLNMITLGTEITRMSLLVTLLIGVSARVLWIPVASLVATACGVILSIVVSRRLVPALKFRTSEIRWRVARNVTNFGGWFYLGQISTLIYEHSSRIILNKCGSAVDVNAFHLGSIADSQLRRTAMVGSAPLQPAMTTLHSQGQKQRLGNIYLRGNRYSLWATLFLAVPLFVFRTDLFRLYVDEIYLDAATVLALLLLTYPFIFSNHMLPKLVIATAKLPPFQLRAIGTHAMNLVLSLYFVGYLKMGAIGPALATFLVCAFGQPLLFWRLGWRMANVSGLRWVRESLLPGMTPALMSVTMLFAIRQWDRPDSWIELAAYSAVGSAVYLFVLIAFCLQSDEKNDLLTILAKVKTKFMFSQA